MLRKYYRVAIGMLLAVFMVFGGAISPLSGAFDVFAVDNGKWIYINGQSGNDGNDGSSDTSAVKSWGRAKELLGCEEGGIYVVGTVDASGEISTKNPAVQTVKRDKDIVMFNVNGEAIFANIDVDGEDRHYNSEVVRPNSYSTVYFLSGANFHNIGYVEDPSENQKDLNNNGAYAGLLPGIPDNTTGGLVCSLIKNINIIIDGASFRDNNGKGVFFAPLKGDFDGPSDVNVTMKSGTATGNKGFFYHNENFRKTNSLTVYNALITGNDASHIGKRYTKYVNRTCAVYVCDMGVMNFSEGAAIFGNRNYDVMQQYDHNDGDNQGSGLHLHNGMLGNGSHNWGALVPVGQNANHTDRGEFYGKNSNPTESDKAGATEIAKNQAKPGSVLENNQSIVIDTNGVVDFISEKDKKPQGTPTVTPIMQGCDDTSTEPTKGKLTTTVNGSNGSQAAELVAGADGKIITDVTDKIDYSGLKGGATYTVFGTLIEKESGDAVATASKNDCVADESGNGSWEITFKDVTLEAGKTYVVYEEAVNNADDKDKAEHKDKEDPAQTLVVKTPEETTPPVEDDGHLKTTVQVDDKQASSKAAVQTKAGKKNVTDTIDYEGLEKGATYKVNGTLYNVTDGKDVATASEEKEAVDTKGSWEITFKEVKLEAGKKYVVFEEATLIKDGEGNEVEDGKKFVHKDTEDKAQTIVVKEEEVPPTPDKPDTPVSPTSKIKLTTKVKNQYISPAKDQTIIDIVTAEGLEEGKEYTLKGEIRKADGSEKGTVISSSNAPCPITLDVDQAEMTFSKIDASSLKAGDKLVVFEYLYEGDDEATKDFKPGDDKEIAKHADINSAAQTTMIVDGQIKISKKADVEIVEAGKDVPYTITVTNERNVPAVVDVVDTPEAGLIYKEADNDASYDSDEKTVIWEDLEVPANGTITLSIVFTVSKDASGKLKNRAKVNEPDNPGNVLGINEDDDDVKVLGVYDEENDDNPKNKAKTKGANTGDDAPMAGAILALLAAAGAFEVMRRRRMN